MAIGCWLGCRRGSERWNSPMGWSWARGTFVGPAGPIIVRSIGPGMIGSR